MTDIPDLKKLRGLAKNEGCLFAKLAKGQRCFVGNMKQVDADGTVDIPNEVLQITADEFKRRCPDTVLLLVTVSQTTARVYTVIPNGVDITSSEWLASIGMDSSVKELLEGEYLKFRDAIINSSFDFLKSKRLLVDEESDDEVCYTFDD